MVIERGDYKADAGVRKDPACSFRVLPCGPEREGRYLAEPADAVAREPLPRIQPKRRHSEWACRAAGGVEMPALASGTVLFLVVFSGRPSALFEKSATGALKTLVERPGDIRRDGPEAHPLCLRLANGLFGGAPA